MKEKIEGKWKVYKSENLDEILKALGTYVCFVTLRYIVCFMIDSCNFKSTL